MSGETDLLGWLDGENNGDGNKRPAALTPGPSPVGRARGDTALIPGPDHSVAPAVGRARGGAALTPGLSPETGEGRTYGVAGEKGDDWAAAELLSDVGCMLHDSFGQVGDQPHGNLTLPALTPGPSPATGEGREREEWDGTDLLLLAALGLLLVVVLSWLFPMSWPEGFSPSGWLRMRLQNWWHTWWLRWGTVVLLVAVLMKLIHVRAKSEQGNRRWAAR